MARGRAGRAGVVLLLTVACGGCVEGRADGTASQLSDQEPAAFDLYTHCGIHELTYGGQWYERIGGVLDDGQGNPPAGWDNPYHVGTLTTSGATAIFTDQAGHRETFALRVGATGPKTVCA